MAPAAWRLHADDKSATSDAPPVNLYLAREGLSPKKLLDFIDRMKDKPKSLRGRPGFSEAILDAADRILASDADSSLKTAAAIEKLGELHFQACRGDTPADKQLHELLDDVGGKASGKLAAEVQFFKLERRVLAADDLPSTELPALLDEVRTYFAKRTPTVRDLRLASATVRVINHLPSDEEAEHAYQEFGAIFARSDDRTLSRYGRTIEKGTKPPSLVSKPLELSGILVDGTPLDWAAYRGKIVLVDFWATWCGPCRAELPNVKAAYDAYHERGFEIVGVSLDDDRQTLTDYLRDEQIPWPNLFTEGDGGGWKHAMAVKYNIRAIPATFLVDREGKVIAENVRGADMSQRLAELLRDKSIPAEQAPSGQQPSSE